MRFFHICQPTITQGFLLLVVPIPLLVHPFFLILIPLGQLDKSSIFVLFLFPSQTQKEDPVSRILFLSLHEEDYGMVQESKIRFACRGSGEPWRVGLMQWLGELMKSRVSSICMTCEHFTYTCDKSCVTLLTCPLHQRLIPQGEHLTKRCRNWKRKRVLDIGLCPEVA